MNTTFYRNSGIPMLLHGTCEATTCMNWDYDGRVSTIFVSEDCKNWGAIYVLSIQGYVMRHGNHLCETAVVEGLF